VKLPGPIQILRARDRPAVAWKNGGGVTREIAAWPWGADLEAFDWRVSMATVDTGGPFSNFPGVDRILTVLEGELTLRVDGRAPVTLSGAAAPIAFAGDIDVAAETPPRPVTDLNVMTRRGRVTARVERVSLAAPRSVAVSHWTIILCRSAKLSFALGEEAFEMALDDAVLVSGELLLRVTPPDDAPADLIAVHLQPTRSIIGALRGTALLQDDPVEPAAPWSDWTAAS